MTSKAFLLPRLKAGAVHIGISFVVALAATALIFLIWYPAPLSEAQGVSRMVLVLLGVDVCIGPLITCIIFDRAKKSLRMDLAIVAGLQLAALLYGLHAIFIARPVILAFNVDRFDVVTALDVDRESLERARQKGKRGLPWWRPRVVAALLPNDPEARHRILFSAAGGGADLPQLPEWYAPYEQAAEHVARRVRPLSDLRDTNHMDAATWAAFLRSLGRPEADIGYLPMRAKVKDGVVIVDRKTSAIIRIDLLTPRWEMHLPPLRLPAG